MKRIAILLIFTTAALAQAPKGAENNAALRYWNAFAQMVDVKLSDAQTKQLESSANGSTPWDESAFGKLLDDNSGAVETMVRGTALPYCVWGIDYELAADTPIPQIGRGRALSRLNLLTAKRLSAQGKSREATDHLIAGLRFARDLASGMSLIGALVGAAALRDNFSSALQLSSQLNGQDKARYLAAVRTLPEDGLDWSASIRREGDGIHRDLVNLQRAKDPAKVLRDWQMPEASLSNPRPSDSDIQQVDAIMNEGAELLRRPPAQNEAALAALQERASKLKSIGVYIIPNLQRSNEERRDLQSLRQKVLSDM
jgi:hypothetical protein